MDANSGAPWSEADISDPKNELDHGRTFAQTASFLCRDVDEVRQKAKELFHASRATSTAPKAMRRLQATRSGLTAGTAHRQEAAPSRFLQTMIRGTGNALAGPSVIAA